MRTVPRFLSAAAVTTVLFALPAAVLAQDAQPSAVEYRKTTLHDNYNAWLPNGVIVGKHGINEGNLIVASVVTNSVRIVDPESGKILKEWAGEENGMLGADDVTEGPDGTIYHVNADGPGLGYIRPNGEIGVLAKDDFEGGWTNAIAISEDGKTLFFTQAIGQDAIYTLDLSDPNARAVQQNVNHE